MKNILPSLPNLFLWSTSTLIGLYTLLGLVIITAVQFMGVLINYAVSIGVGVILFNFLIGPWLMDLTLRWTYKMAWWQFDELPMHLQNFVKDVCIKNRIKVPRFGVIEDYTPQAFTYGHTPSNGRIVITRGILESLAPEEIEAVVAHELGHIKHWDIALMTLVQLVPLILYYIYRTLSKDSKRPSNAIAAIAYLIYIASEYVALWFSRVREYHADRFSAFATGNPSTLSSALVKIAYGMSKQDASRKSDLSTGAFATMGIASAATSNNMMLVMDEDQLQIDKGKLMNTLRWDLEKSVGKNL